MGTEIRIQRHHVFTKEIQYRRKRSYSLVGKIYSSRHSLASPWSMYYKWVVSTVRKKDVKAVDGQEVSIRPSVTEER